MLSKSEFLSLYSTVLIVKSFEFDVRNGNWFLQSVVRSCVLSGNGQVSVYGNQVSRVLNMMVWPELNHLDNESDLYFLLKLLRLDNYCGLVHTPFCVLFLMSFAHTPFLCYIHGVWD